MIQRIQSVYLVLTTLFSVLFLNGSILRFVDESGQLFHITIGGLLSSSSGPVPYINSFGIPLVILFIAVTIFPLVVIFFFRNRKLQIKLTFASLALLLITILFVGVYIFISAGKYNIKIIPGVRMLLPLLMMVCLFLAYRGIRKDEELVKSYGWIIIPLPLASANGLWEIILSADSPDL